MTLFYLQILLVSDAAGLLLHTDGHPRLFLERDLDQRLLHPDDPTLHVHPQHDLVGQFCRPYVRKQTIRQVSSLFSD